MKIVNIRLDKFDTFGGRGSIIGNPFEIPRDGDRDEVIRKYRRWFNFAIRDAIFKKYVESLKDKTVGCYCKQPNLEVACHLDIIKEYLDNLCEILPTL